MGGCSESPYWPSVAGSAKLTLAQLKQSLEDSNGAQVWLNRIGGMLLAIVGIALCLSPIAVAADIVGDVVSYIPCLGGFLEETIEGVVGNVLCAISCAVGVGSGLLVIGLMQLVLRPLIGAACLGGFFLCCCGAYAIGKSSDKPGKKQKGSNSNDMEMQQPRMEQPMYQGQPQYGDQPMAQPMVDPGYQGGSQPMPQPMMAPGYHLGTPMAQPMIQPQSFTITVP